MKPVYQHNDGTFGPPDYFVPGRFVVTEGLLGFYNDELADSFDVRVYLAPPEELRRAWKVQRDCSRRGYTTDQVLSSSTGASPTRSATSGRNGIAPTSSSPSSRGSTKIRNTSIAGSRCATRLTTLT